MKYTRLQYTSIICSILLLCSNAIYSQCDIHDFIEENYSFDAKILALREIMNNENDPDYSNPFIEEERYKPYLEQLSAIYENTTANPVIDSLFQEFQFHVLIRETSPNKLILGIDNQATWINDFIETGISGVPAIDNLISTYNFSSVDFSFDTDDEVFVEISSANEVLNLVPIANEFASIDDILSVEKTTEDIPAFNYTGIPYEIPYTFPQGKGSETVERVDIYNENNRFHFWMGAGDCFSGCILKKEYIVEVDENCNATQVFNTPDFQHKKITLYPNPVHNNIQIEGVTEEIKTASIYSITGQLINTASKVKTLNVSHLTPGVYFVYIQIKNGATSVKKIIKK